MAGIGTGFGDASFSIVAIVFGTYKKCKKEKGVYVTLKCRLLKGLIMYKLVNGMHSHNGYEYEF